MMLQTSHCDAMTGGCPRSLSASHPARYFSAKNDATNDKPVGLAITCARSTKKPPHICHSYLHKPGAAGGSLASINQPCIFYQDRNKVHSQRDGANAKGMLPCSWKEFSTRSSKLLFAEDYRSSVLIAGTSSRYPRENQCSLSLPTSLSGTQSKECSLMGVDGQNSIACSRALHLRERMLTGLRASLTLPERANTDGSECECNAASNLPATAS
ncbi:hypothetical protein BDZ45DRAFT_474165 [Acephala macrosclerotiorum]|nr:hypothetical protein BDZ45DRAFT_474165 [Acephala macrosclerotiorum]